MFIKSYEYIIPKEKHKDYTSIEGINREDYISDQYINMVGQIVLDRPTAILYAGGFSISQSESRDVSSVDNRFIGSIGYNKSTMVLRESTAYCMHKWIGSMKNNTLVRYASINSNTCASSMYSIYEAERLLRESHIDEVIIIAEERTSFNTLRIFKEHRIPLIVSDGLAIIRLTKEDFNKGSITDTKWSYQYNRNPFYTSQEGYSAVISEADFYKVHGTGTKSNDAAEENIPNKIIYKDKIGHTQGVSGLLELCIAVDDPSLSGSVCCVASGLGGFYGSCILNKR